MPCLPFLLLPLFPTPFVFFADSFSLFVTHKESLIFYRQVRR
jgi:hypothetical protein